MGREFNVADKLMLSKAYKEHHVFKELDEMTDFYEAVSNMAFYFFPSGTKVFPNYESYYFLSIQGTLDSIKTLLKIARINSTTTNISFFHFLMKPLTLMKLFLFLLLLIFTLQPEDLVSTSFIQCLKLF